MLSINSIQRTNQREFVILGKDYSSMGQEHRSFQEMEDKRTDEAFQEARIPGVFRRNLGLAIYAMRNVMELWLDPQASKYFFMADSFFEPCKLYLINSAVKLDIYDLYL